MPFLMKRASRIEPDLQVARGVGVESALAASWDRYVPGDAIRSATQRRPPAIAGQQICASDECAGGWQMPWKNRRRPIFEGQWGCNAKCLAVIIRRSLRREGGNLSVQMQAPGPHRHRIPLGLVMLSQGWITQAQLRRALDAQRSSGEGRIGEWLVRESSTSPAQVTRALAIQWSCPVLPIDGFTPSAMALTMPRVFVEELGLLPLRVAGSRILYLAFNDRLDASASFALERMSALRVESGLVEEKQFDAARSRLLESSFADVTNGFAADTDALGTKIAAILEQMQPVGARIVRLHQRYWLRIWLENGAYSGVGGLPATGEDVRDMIFTLDHGI